MRSELQFESVTPRRLRLLRCYQLLKHTRMVRLFNRVVAGLAGAFAGLLAVSVPIDFYRRLFSNSRAVQANQPLDFSNGLGGSLIVLLLTAVLAFVSYILINFALTTPKPAPPDSDD